MMLYNESIGKKLENLLKNAKHETGITWGIWILKKASGCLKDVSGCYEQASRCVHLLDPKTTNIMP